jgi:hypothetical protein
MSVASQVSGDGKKFGLVLIPSVRIVIAVSIARASAT